MLFQHNFISHIITALIYAYGMQLISTVLAHSVLSVTHTHCLIFALAVAGFLFIALFAIEEAKQSIALTASVCVSVCLSVQSLEIAHKLTQLGFYSAHRFLPESDYVTFGSLLWQIRLPSVVCLSSVTFVCPGALLRELKLSVIFLRHFVP